MGTEYKDFSFGGDFVVVCSSSPSRDLSEPVKLCVLRVYASERVFFYCSVLVCRQECLELQQVQMQIS